MTTVRTLSERLPRTLDWLAALTVLLATQVALAQPPVCSSGCVGACTLTYSAEGVVRDNVTGMPIASAQITLLDAEGVSAEDGAYSVRGSRPNQCHFDYFYSFSVTAPGYEPLQDSGYWTGIAINYEIRLNPVSQSGNHVVSGIVAEFPSCTGAMRGVTVVLEPLNITTTTSVDAGRFAFRDVPPGDYTLRVLEGCNPFGCWEVEPVRVGSDNVDLTVCMTAIGPDPSPTPTPTAGPSATFTVCPIKTPCVLGERPQYCEERCGVGCGCEQCPDCPDGFVSAPLLNACECIPDPNVTPPPTPTRTMTSCPTVTPLSCPLGKGPLCDDAVCQCHCEECAPCPSGSAFLVAGSCLCAGAETPTPLPCLFPTPPLCPIGQTANCPHVPCGTTDAGCFCDTCPPCPDGLNYGGGFNSCACVDPRAFTVTPTPDLGTSPTPTPNICAFPTPPLCPVGQTPHCISTECIVGCGCEPCEPCPDGLVYSGEINRCDCVDPNAPTRTPTPTPNLGDTPPSCPTRTPPLCPTDTTIVCDTSVDPCGVCNCRAVPQEPVGEDSSLSPSSSGGCATTSPRDAEATLWFWSIPVIALALRMRKHRRHT